MLLKQHEALGCGISVRRSWREADIEVATVANADEIDVYAVLSNDSDFFIFNVPGYVPLFSLNVTPDGDVYGTRYPRHALVLHCRFEPSLLSVFAWYDPVTIVCTGDRV